MTIAEITTFDDPCGCPSPGEARVPPAPAPRPLLVIEDEDADTRVCVRALTPSDAGLLEGWFDDLSPESRRLRFFGPKTELTGADRRRFLDLDDRCRHTLVATVRGENGDERAVGMAGFVCEDGHPGEAEMAAAVIDEFQGHGVGSALLRRLGCSARHRGIDTLTAEVLWDNGTMRRLLRRLVPTASGVAAGGGALRYRLAPSDLLGDLDCV